MDTKIKARLGWIKLYLEKQDFGYVCRHCGISRTTLRKWYRRYNATGIEGLSDISKKPHNSSNKKLREQLIEKILTLRNERNIGARRIQLELFIQEGTRLSLASIHKALKRSNVKPIKNLKRDKKFKRYQRPVPGDSVQGLTLAKLLLVYISIPQLMIVHVGVLWSYISAAALLTLLILLML